MKDLTGDGGKCRNLFRLFLRRLLGLMVGSFGGWDVLGFPRLALRLLRDRKSVV